MPVSSVIWIRAGATALGSTWWSMRCHGRSPYIRVTTTYSRSRTVRTPERSTRARPGENTMPTASIAFVRLAPSAVVIASAMTRPGSTSSASATRIRTMSTSPPA